MSGIAQSCLTDNHTLIPRLALKVQSLLSHACYAIVASEWKESVAYQEVYEECRSATSYPQMAPGVRKGILEIRACQKNLQIKLPQMLATHMPVHVLRGRSTSCSSFSCPHHVSTVAQELLRLPAPSQSLEVPTRSQLVTSSKTSFSLYCVRAEHSTYLTAPSSRAMRSPSSRLTGAIRCFSSFSLTDLSSLRSTWVPTIRHGTPGQWWCTSGNHFSRTFSNDAGEVTEKHTRNTSVWGYDRGRRRS